MSPMNENQARQKMRAVAPGERPAGLAQAAIAEAHRRDRRTKLTAAVAPVAVLAAGLGTAWWLTNPSTRDAHPSPLQTPSVTPTPSPTETSGSPTATPTQTPTARPSASGTPTTTKATPSRAPSSASNPTPRGSSTPTSAGTGAGRPADAGSNKANVGTWTGRPGLFSDGRAGTASLNALRMCFGVDPSTSTLGKREASRMSDWVSETAESSADRAAVVFTTEAEAKAFYAELKNNADICAHSIVAGANASRQTTEITATKVSGAAESFGVRSEYLAMDGTAVDQSMGREVAVARNGRSVSVAAASIYFLRPLSENDTSVHAEVTSEAARLLKGLPS